MTKVVSMRGNASITRQPDVIRIDRATRWGNPFRITPSKSREEVLKLYRVHLWTQIKAGNVSLENLAALHGKTLACWCKPAPCHGDILSKGCLLGSPTDSPKEGLMNITKKISGRAQMWLDELVSRGHTPDVYDQDVGELAGQLNPFVLDADHHNGPGCTTCGWKCCWYCDRSTDQIPPCKGAQA